MSSIQIVLIISAVVFALFALFLLFFKQEKGLKKALICFFAAILQMVISWGISKWLDSVYQNSIQLSNSLVLETEISSTPAWTKETTHVHKASSQIKRNITDCTCTEAGSYDLVQICECGQELEVDTIQLEPLGHNYIDGICTRCNIEDPNYVKSFSGDTIISILSSSVVSDTGTYQAYLGSESISVFAEDKYNCFSINTAVSYNLWGGNVQEVIFNVSNLCEIGVLGFKIGGETGDRGEMYIEFFLDKIPDNSPDYAFDLNAADLPIDVSLDISNTSSLGIRVTNKSSNQNRLVFFDFCQGEA